MNAIRIANLIWVVLLSGAATAQPVDDTQSPSSAEGKTRIVVYRLQADEGIRPLADQISDEILVHLGKTPCLDVVGEAEVKVLLAHEEDKQAVACEDLQACAARLSAVVRADRIITGHVGRIGETFVVTVKLADASKAVVVGAEAGQAESTEGLPAAAFDAVDRLLGIQAPESRERFHLEFPPGGMKMAVIDLAAYDVAPGLAENLTQLLSIELKKFERVSVISRGEIQAMLRFESERQALRCKSDISCLVEIGGALGVDYLVGGSVGRLGDAFVVTLKLMDIHKAQVAHRASQSFRGSETDLALALRFATWDLLGRSVDGKGTLAVEANVEEAEIAVDGGETLKYPEVRVIPDLTVGRHGIFITAEGYVPTYRETYVTHGGRTDIDLALEELPTPWYEKWWVWTIVGSLVIGGTITAAVLLQPDDPTTGAVTVTVE